MDEAATTLSVPGIRTPLPRNYLPGTGSEHTENQPVHKSEQADLTKENKTRRVWKVHDFLHDL